MVTSSGFSRVSVLNFSLGFGNRDDLLRRVHSSAVCYQMPNSSSTRKQGPDQSDGAGSAPKQQRPKLADNEKKVTCFLLIQR